MYGSQGCSFCGRQRTLFGDAFERIDEIECDVRYPDFDPQPKRCVAKEIVHTPTWMIEDSEGNELFRYEPGVVSLEDLSEKSGCALPEENK